MVRAGSSIEIYVLRHDLGDVLFRASSIDNAIITGVRKAFAFKLKHFVILDSDCHELFHGGLANY